MTKLVDNTNHLQGGPQTGLRSGGFFAGDVNMVSAIAGEENPSQLFSSQMRVTEDWDYYVGLTGTTEQLVIAGDCRVKGIFVNNGVTPGVITLRDAASISGGSTGFIFSGSTFLDLTGLRFDNGLTFQAATTGAGVYVLYRAGKFA